MMLLTLLGGETHPLYFAEIHTFNSCSNIRPTSSVKVSELIKKEEGRYQVLFKRVNKRLKNVRNAYVSN